MATKIENAAPLHFNQWNNIITRSVIE